MEIRLRQTYFMQKLKSMKFSKKKEITATVQNYLWYTGWKLKSKNGTRKCSVNTQTIVGVMVGTEVKEYRG